MNKAFAELFASFIPHKMSRNRWRGIFRFGLINAIRLKKDIKKNELNLPKYYLTLCAIAKNEGAYFKEWLEWHKSKGVEKFYIYDNDSTDDTKEVLKPYIESGLVEYTFFLGKKRQLAAYDDCLKRHRFDSHWIAVIDLDEFIVPIKDKSISGFLKRFECFAAVEINWLIYGSGGAKKKEKGNVMERFCHHSELNHFSNRHVKTIINPRCVFNFIGCHEASIISGHTADSHGEPIKYHFRDREPQQDVICINHYAVKSYEEFLEKRARGRARINKLRNLEYFEKYDLNDMKTVPHP